MAKKKCEGTAKSTGLPCRQSAEPGKTKCRFHGGKTPSGIASANFKHGRYSKHRVMPARMIDAYEASLNDPEVLALDKEIALVDARLTELLENMDTAGSGQLWAEADRLYTASMALQEELTLYPPDSAEAAIRRRRSHDIMHEVGQVIKRGKAGYGVWQEIQNTIERRRRLVESERKRRVDMHYMVKVDEFATFAQTVLASIRANVTDKKALAAIAKDVYALTESTQ